jgi:hypothetical protein
LILSIVVNFLFECFLGWETKIPTRLRGGNYKKIMDGWETKIPTVSGGDLKIIRGYNFEALTFKERA